MEQIISVIIYLINFSLSAFLILQGLKSESKKNKLFFLTIGLLIPSILAGIRYNVGTDYATYLKMYNNTIENKEMYYRPIEPLSAALIYISAYIKSEFFLFFSFNILTNFFFLSAFKRFFNNNAKQTSIAFFIYLCILYSTTLNAMRSGVSLSITTYIFSILLSAKNTKKTICQCISLLIIAYLFHKTTLIFLLFIPAFLISKKYSGKKPKVIKTILLTIYTITPILLPLLYTSFKSMINLGHFNKYIKYVGNNFSIPIANLIILLPVIFAISLIIINKRKNKNDAKLQEITYYSLYYIPLIIITGWLTYTKGMSRISFTLEPVIIILITMLLTTKQYLSKLQSFFAITVMSSVIILMFIRNLNWSKALPYTTIFQKEYIDEK